MIHRLTLQIDDLNLHSGTQQRVALDPSHVAKLEDLISEQSVDPISVTTDGNNYWVTDGFHRVQAHKNQQIPEIEAVVTQGTLRDAILASITANTGHAVTLARSREDKRKAILTLLKDPEWTELSDRAIANMAGVSHPTVSALRKSLTKQTDKPPVVNLPVTPMTEPLTQKCQSDPIQEVTLTDDPIPENEPEPPPKITVNLQEIYLGFKSNIPYFTDSYLRDILESIYQLHPHLNP